MASDASDPLLDAFGTAVKQLRMRRGLSQEALARLAEVERTYVTEVERGRRNVTLRNIGRLAAALGVGIGDLMSVAEKELDAGDR